MFNYSNGQKRPNKQQFSSSATAASSSSVNAQKLKAYYEQQQNLRRVHSQQNPQNLQQQQKQQQQQQQPQQHNSNQETYWRSDTVLKDSSKKYNNYPAGQKMSLINDPLASFKARKDAKRKRVLDSYDIVGYIAAGTYGKVYKAKPKNAKFSGKLYAIKKFKADKEGEIVHYTGVSQSACREMALCRELNHRNVVKLAEIILEDKCIYMAFEYAEHDLLQIIHYHTHPDRKQIPESIVKSVLWQILNGVSYLHQNWILHRDLKPANIMLTADGVVKVGDLGLARLYSDPLQSFFTGDKVVVTIWYRAPELLLGGRHYTPAIDLWAVGCIFAELLALRPIFKGEEAKMDSKKTVPFQRNQFQKVTDILGSPTVEQWPSLVKYPEFPSFHALKPCKPNLDSWYRSIDCHNAKGFRLLQSLFEYDPAKRITAQEALLHPYFSEAPQVSMNVFQGHKYNYPVRRITVEDIDIKGAAYTGSSNKRNVVAADDTLHPRKKQK